MASPYLFPERRVTGASLWDRVKYNLDTRRTDLDKAAAGITFAQDGDDILITVASGTAAHANPSEGAYLVWDHRCSLSGGVVDFTPGLGFQGLANAHLAVLDGLGDGQGIEILTGRINVTAASQQGIYGGLVDATDPTVVAARMLASTMTRTVDANPSGNAVAVLQDANKNAGTGGIITNRNFVLGLTTTDPSAGNPGSSPFDVAESAGALAFREKLCLNVRNASGVATATDVTYRVRLRAMIIDWGA